MAKSLSTDGRVPVLALGLALASVILAIPAPAGAATIDVTGDCSLADAIHSANFNIAIGTCQAGTGADTIRLLETVSLTTVNNFDLGSNGLPLITSEITIRGFNRKVERVAGSPAFRIFHVTDSGDLTLDRVRVEGGRINGTSANAAGAGILCFGKLRLTGSVVRGNTVTSTGGGGGGGIVTPFGASLFIRDSVIASNHVIGADSVSGGGINHFGERVEIYDSTIRDNTVTGGLFAYGGGLDCGMESTLVIRGSTFSGNEAAAPQAFGGAIFTTSLLVENTTVSGNSASDVAGGIFASRGLVRHVTFYGNSAPSASSLGEGGSDAESIELSGSIFAAASANHCTGAILDKGGNVADDNTCRSTIQVSGDPLVQPTLANLGGATLVHSLAPGSDAIHLAGNCGLGVDQRSAGRAPPCDSGAYEAIGCLLFQLRYTAITGFSPPYATCDTAVLGPELFIAGSGVHLDVTAGHLIVIKNGFSVQGAARVTLRIDPSISP